jgi:dolichol-phosphate mannosyltransferase
MSTPRAPDLPKPLPAPIQLRAVAPAVVPFSGGRRPDLLSVVVPAGDAAAASAAAALPAALEQALGATPFELLLVADGGPGAGRDALGALARRDPRVRLLELSRHFGRQRALTAGLDHALGDVAVTLDALGQDPPALAAGLLERWRSGADVVHALPRGRRRARAGHAILLDRQALDALLLLRERSRSLRAMAGWIGFDQAEVPYDRLPRPRRSRARRLPRSGRAAIPRVALATAALAFAAAAVAGAAVLAGHPVAGLDAVHALLLGLGGLQLATFGMAARLYEEVRGRPLYVLRAERDGDHDALGPAPPPPVPLRAGR